MSFLQVDLHSLIILISLSNLVQIAVFYIQYKLNSSYKGIGFWAISILLTSIGFLISDLRLFPELTLLAFFLNNVFFIIGMGFWIVGTYQFFSQKARYFWLIAFCTIIIIISFLTTYIFENYLIHRINFFFGVSILSFSAAWHFFRNDIKSIRKSSIFLAALFLFSSIFSLLNILMFISKPNNLTNIAPENIQNSIYFFNFFSGIVRTFGVVIMINQRLNAEILHSLKNQEILFNTSPDSILITRLSDGQFVGVNEGFIHMTGYTRGEVLHKTTLELDIWVHPENRADFVNKLQKNDIVENVEYEFRRKNNTTLTGLISARIIDFHKEPHIISVIHDISNRKIADQKFRMLFELSPIGLSMVDNETGKYLEVNEALLEMTGYTKDEFLQLSYWDITPKDYRELEAKQMKDILETGFFGPNEKEYLRKDGSRFNISISGVLVKGSQGQSINWGFIEDITERKKLQEELKKQATTDELTGLYNRRHFLDLAQKEIKRSIRNFHPVTIGLFDLDRLKFFNDSFGHNFGDKALITFATQCKANLRDIDIFARYGGDEFVLLLPETSIEEAEIVVERIRKIINQSIIQIDEKAFNISTSIGLATLEHRNDTLDEVLARADTALYMAKDQGKNCVVTKYDTDFRWPVNL